MGDLRQRNKRKRSILITVCLTCLTTVLVFATRWSQPRTSSFASFLAKPHPTPSVSSTGVSQVSSSPDGFAEVVKTSKNTAQSSMRGSFLREKRAGVLWRQPEANPGGLRSPTLLTIHTAHNAWNMVRLMLVSLAAVSDDFDVLLIDDHADKYDQNQLAESWGVQVYRWGNGSESPRGVTHSWNLAWMYAVENEYENLIICNNDLLVPEGSISKLTGALASGAWDWIVPIVSKRGSFYPKQNLKKMYGEDVQDWTDHPLHFSEVARGFDREHDGHQPVIPVRQLNGYAMAFSVNSMKKYQFAPDELLLFNPKHVNIGNEDDLVKRISSAGGRTGVHSTAFFFHFKGFTVSQSKNGRESVEGYPVLDDVF